MVTLLGISGSLRRASTNTMLVREAARLFAPDRFEMADLRLPLYDGDLEADGLPEPVERLLGRIEAADALVISTPEYNKMPSGVLKNALDWISRRKPWVTAGKPCVVLSATAGNAGGERATSGLYLMLIPFQLNVIHNPEVFVGRAHTKFDEDGRITDEATLDFLAKKMDALRAAL
ncbi:MAG: NADPH-dependent FMN reductase [Paracoccaceae bacterium]